MASESYTIRQVMAEARTLLAGDAPHFTLALIRLEEYFRSPVHDHGEHWVVACCYRGADRRDVYERTDGRTGPDTCSVELVDQVVLTPGDHTAMPAPPRAIHSHDNLSHGDTSELIFSAARPIPAAERMIYDVASSTCQPSWFEVGDQLRGDYFPPRNGKGVPVTAGRSG